MATPEINSVSSSSYGIFHPSKARGPDPYTASALTDGEKVSGNSQFTEGFEVSNVPEGRSTPPPLIPAIRRSWFYGRFQLIISQCDDRWVLEILSCCMATSCLLAIIAILAVYEGEPLPSSPVGISINSWISIFTAVMKAAVMLPVAEGISQLKWLWFAESRPLIQMETFDSASRGPWGAVLLLISFFRGHRLASFGAFISILALAIDPFSQQVITYYNCFPVSKEYRSLVPRTNNYTGDGISYRPGSAELNEKVINAITLSTISTPGSATNELPFACLGGNCTFPSDATDPSGANFQTLGMCHFCKDISELIRPNASVSGYSLDNWNPNPAWGDWWNEAAYIGYKVPYFRESAPYSMFWSRKTLALSPVFDDVITLDALMLNIEPGCAAETCPTHPWAVRFSLYPCIKTYKSIIVDSVLSETELSSVPLRKSNLSAIEVTQTPNLTYALATDRVLRNGTWTDCLFSDTFSQKTPIAMPKHQTSAANNSGPDILYYESDCVWSFGYTVGLALNQYLSTLYDIAFLEATEPEPARSQLSHGEQVLKKMYRWGTATLETVNDYVAELSGSITAMMRQRGEGGRDPWAVGDDRESRTCIGVKWPWIALPALLIVSSFAFLAATIYASHRKGMWLGAWRSSAVAPFLTGINSHEAGSLVQCTGRKSGMEEVAKQTFVSVVVREEKLVIH